MKVTGSTGTVELLTCAVLLGSDLEEKAGLWPCTVPGGILYPGKAEPFV